jgi:hypothetical protein
MDNQTKQEKLNQYFIKAKYIKKSKNKLIRKDHLIRKRAPFQFSKKKNDIYVNNKTNFKVFVQM